MEIKRLSTVPRKHKIFIFLVIWHKDFHSDSRPPPFGPLPTIFLFAVDVPYKSNENILNSLERTVPLVTTCPDLLQYSKLVK